MCCWRVEFWDSVWDALDAVAMQGSVAQSSVAQDASGQSVGVAQLFQNGCLAHEHLQ